VPAPPDAAGARVAELVAVLSYPADLGLGQPMKHCMRQTVIALRLADHPAAACIFVEHGLAHDERTQRLQRRLERVQRVVFDGCHLTRRIADLVTSAGFTITDLDTFYAQGSPKFAAAMSFGVTRSE
jgi:hypothetical protein